MKNLIVIFILVSSLQLIAQQGISPRFNLPNDGEISRIEESAIKFYTEEIERNPENIQALVLRSELYLALNKQKEAEKDMQMALSLNPYARIYQNREYRKNLFPIKNYSYLTQHEDTKNEKFNKSFILAEQYLEFLNGSNLSATNIMIIELALMAIENKDLDLAKSFLKEMDDDAKNSALYYDLKGVITLEEGDQIGAIRYFDKAITENPSFVIPYHNRAVANKTLGNLDLAEQDFEKALALNAEIAQIHFGKAKLYELKGNMTDASLNYQNALMLEENYSEASTNYSVLLKSTGEFTKSMIELNNAIRENPNDINNYYVRAGLNFIYGSYSDAINDFNKYLEVKTNDIDATFYRGLCKILINQQADGCKDLFDSIDNGYNRTNLEMVIFMCR